jgi:hypothetical protein
MYTFSTHVIHVLTCAYIAIQVKETVCTLSQHMLSMCWHANKQQFKLKRQCVHFLNTYYQCADMKQFAVKETDTVSTNFLLLIFFALYVAFAYKAIWYNLRMSYLSSSEVRSDTNCIFFSNT